MRIFTVVALAVLFVQPALALEWEEGSVLVRVVDVDAGECVVIKIAGRDDDHHYVVFDAGNFADQGKTAIEAIREVVPEDDVIDMLVLSHTDSDHVAAVPLIVDEYYIDRIIRTGQERQGSRISKTLKNARKAIQRAVDEDGTIDINLSDTEFPAGATYRFGETFVTMVCGFGSIPDGWDVTGSSEIHNATSICLRITHKGKSVLITGDAVGRHLDSPEDALLATEKYMVEQQHVIPIDSDVLVASHHGGNNGSATGFIQAVSPAFVIFSAGDDYEHPRQATVDRIRAALPQDPEMFRTDLGDMKRPREWAEGSMDTDQDTPGDDDVDILIDKAGNLTVKNRDPANN
jgi:beta-lactamase superfamily II metal-dependent hydrolase